MAYFFAKSLTFYIILKYSKYMHINVSSVKIWLYQSSICRCQSSFDDQIDRASTLREITQYSVHFTVYYPLPFLIISRYSSYMVHVVYSSIAVVTRASKIYLQYTMQYPINKLISLGSTQIQDKSPLKLFLFDEAGRIIGTQPAIAAIHAWNSYIATYIWQGTDGQVIEQHQKHAAAAAKAAASTLY